MLELPTIITDPKTGQPTVVAPKAPTAPDLSTIIGIGKTATDVVTGNVAGIAGDVAAVATSGAISAGTLFGIDVGRMVAIILGLLCIAAGLFLFRPVRETVVATGKAAAETAIAA